MAKAKLQNKINLYDFLVASSVDYDTFDTEYDAIVTVVCIDDEPNDNYDKFYQEMCRNVEIVKICQNGLIVNWCECIKRNFDKFKQFTKDNWKASCQYEEDEDEFIYQWIYEINQYFIGNVSDDFYSKLVEFVKTLK